MTFFREYLRIFYYIMFVFLKVIQFTYKKISDTIKKGDNYAYIKNRTFNCRSRE